MLCSTCVLATSRQAASKSPYLQTNSSSQRDWVISEFTWHARLSSVKIKPQVLSDRFTTASFTTLCFRLQRFILSLPSANRCSAKSVFQEQTPKRKIGSRGSRSSSDPNFNFESLSSDHDHGRDHPSGATRPCRILV